MNTFGSNFRLTTFGESHGPAIGGVIDGCPSGIRLDMDLIHEALRRRREGDTSLELPSTESLVTARQEPDTIEWLSGLLDGETLGTPIAFIVRNKDCHSSDYDNLRTLQRPGHADFTYQARYGIRDHRGGGRASARETLSRVIAGSVALQALRLHHPIQFRTTYQVPALTQPNGTYDAATTFGGSVICSVTGVPAGVGSPVFGRLNARLSEAMMTIPSAVAFEMGMGCAASSTIGANYTDAWTIPPQQHDAYQLEDFERFIHQEAHQAHRATLFNHCGGVQGGISNGDPLLFRVHFHPVATAATTLRCRDDQGLVHPVAVQGRHDSCHVLRTPVIVESMAALVLADELLPKQ